METYLTFRAENSKIQILKICLAIALNHWQLHINVTKCEVTKQISVFEDLRHLTCNNWLYLW